MSSFFDNFMGGLAFGMLVSNPLYRGMGGFGYGCGFGGVGGFIFGGMYNAVSLTGFINPFPSVFGGGYGMGYGGGYAVSDLMMPTTFANPGFPSANFTEVGQTIWDMCTNPNSDYNKTMKNWYQNMNMYMNINPFANLTNKPKEEKTDKEEEDKAKKDTPKVENSKAKEAETKKSEQKAKKNEKITIPEAKKEKAQVEQAEPIEIVYDAKVLQEKWASKAKTFDDKCFKKVVKISKKIKCDPNDLMSVMWYETAHTFDPSKTNRIGATGLIQFVETTANSLGTTTEKLRKMTVEKQLKYVEKYLVTRKKDAGYKDNEQLDAGTLYSLVFLPGRSKRDVLTSRGEKFYSQNPSLDYNKDGKITKLDLSSVVKDNLA